MWRWLREWDEALVLVPFAIIAVLMLWAVSEMFLSMWAQGASIFTWGN